MEEFNENDRIIITGTDDFWEGKSGIIISEEDDEVLVKVILDNEKNILQYFPKKFIESNNSNGIILEQIEKNKSKDIIHNYVYLEDMDSKNIPYWFFAARIAVAEDMSEEEVIELAKKFGYKIYEMTADHFSKIIIAAKNCSKDIIYDDYGSCLLGHIEISEVK